MNLLATLPDYTGLIILDLRVLNQSEGCEMTSMERVELSAPIKSKVF